MKSKQSGPLLLIILDGWGERKEREGNAIALAEPPFYRSLLQGYPSTLIHTSGEAVGLPEGQMGNSEVGHITIGAGRIVYQDYLRVNRAITDGSFFTNPALVQAARAAKVGGGALHLMGLLSDGGVHSHITHLFSLLDLAKREGLQRVSVHAFLDGRDTPPTQGIKYLTEASRQMKKRGTGTIATIAGRYYAMDRDNRWNRVKKAYEAMVLGEGEKGCSPLEAIKQSYGKGITDEFVLPTVIVGKNGIPLGTIRDGDSVIFYNFRADRARELTRALIKKDFEGFKRKIHPRLSFYATMTSYDETFECPVAFPPVRLTQILGRLISDRGMRQLRIAETEKYAHVTYFFNGGEERVFPGEERILIPSPTDVATYDEKPEMSAYLVAEEAAKWIGSGQYDLIVLNFANPDMVGHTGVLTAAMKAVRVIDQCLEKVCVAALKKGGTVIITADHGNVEQMIDPDTGGPHTAHTTNPVPLLLLKKRVRLRKEGTLADIAPTLCQVLGIDIPEEMTGRSLLR